MMILDPIVNQISVPHGHCLALQHYISQASPTCMNPGPYGGLLKHKSQIHYSHGLHVYKH